MKATVEISDALFAQAQNLLEAEKTTLHALVEEGLRRVIADHAQRRPFKLRTASFRGQGLQPGLANADWEQIRSLAYEEPGE